MCTLYTKRHKCALSRPFVLCIRLIYCFCLSEERYCVHYLSGRSRGKVTTPKCDENTGKKRHCVHCPLRAKGARKVVVRPGAKHDPTRARLTTSNLYRCFGRWSLSSTPQGLGRGSVRRFMTKHPRRPALRPRYFRLGSVLSRS